MTVRDHTSDHASFDAVPLPAAWPPLLRSAVEISRASPVGMLVVAGADMQCACNGAAAALLGDDDAASVATAPLLRRWPHAHALVSAVSRVLASGVAHVVEHAELPLTLDGVRLRRPVMLACSPLATPGASTAAGVLVVLVPRGPVTALAQPLASLAPAAHLALTSRESQILKLIGDGLQVKQVAGVLNISVSSVNTYRNRIFRKTGLASNAAVIRYALKNGLVS